MNFRLVKQLKNVSAVASIKNGRVFYISKRWNFEVVKLDGDLTPEFICSNAVNATTYEDYINITTRPQDGQVNELKIYDTVSNEIVGSAKDINSFFTVNKNACEIYYSKKDGDVYGIYCYNWCEERTEFMMQGKFLLFPKYIEPLLITRAESNVWPDYVIAYDVRNRTIVWQYDCREVGKHYDFMRRQWLDGKVREMMADARTVLLLVVTKVICLDTFKGTVNWIFENQKGLDIMVAYLETTGEVLVFDSTQFYILDRLSGQVLRSSDNLKPELAKYAIRGASYSNPVITESHIYVTFCSERKIAVFDKYNFSIVHVIEINSVDRPAQSDPPIVLDNMVIQLTMDDILHIYEKV
jgi:outer membrane protein assembly factor BamB